MGKRAKIGERRKRVVGEAPATNGLNVPTGSCPQVVLIGGSLSGFQKMVKRTIYKAHLSRMRPNNARHSGGGCFALVSVLFRFGRLYIY